MPSCRANVRDKVEASISFSLYGIQACWQVGNDAEIAQHQNNYGFNVISIAIWNHLNVIFVVWYIFMLNHVTSGGSDWSTLLKFYQFSLYNNVQNEPRLSKLTDTQYQVSWFWFGKILATAAPEPEAQKRHVTCHVTLSNLIASVLCVSPCLLKTVDSSLAAVSLNCVGLSPQNNSDRYIDENHLIVIGPCLSQFGFHCHSSTVHSALIWPFNPKNSQCPSSTHFTLHLFNLLIMICLAFTDHFYPVIFKMVPIGGVVKWSPD